MTFYKIIKIFVHRNMSITYRIKYDNNAIVHVSLSDNDYIIDEFGVVMTPIYDPNNILIGFTDYAF